MTKRRKTAGELSLKALSDNTKYDPLELGHALTDDVLEQLQICALRHEPIFDEEEYCLILIVAGDPLISGVRRHKYAAFPYLPKPRPQQSVYIYNKITKNIRRLWTLPNAKVMAVISEMSSVAPQWKKTKGWCDAFFHGFEREGNHYINKKPRFFFNYIRHQNNIKMLSEAEFLEANREELIKAGCKETNSAIPQSFDFSKIHPNQIINSIEPLTD